MWLIILLLTITSCANETPQDTDLPDSNVPSVPTTPNEPEQRPPSEETVDPTTTPMTNEPDDDEKVEVVTLKGGEYFVMHGQSGTTLLVRNIIKAYAVEDGEGKEVGVTPFRLSIGRSRVGTENIRFYSVRVGEDAFVYPSNGGCQFIQDSERGIYLACTEYEIWLIDPYTCEGTLLTSDT